MPYEYNKQKYIENKIIYLKLSQYEQHKIIGGAMPIRMLAQITPVEATYLYVLKNPDIDNLFPDAKNIDPTGLLVVNKGDLMINKIGLYSMTKPDAAQKIINVIKKYIDPSKSIIINATSGIGGDLINMAPYFKCTIGYEIDPVQFSILRNNVNVYKIKAILYNDDYTKNINRDKADVILIDPPWGGLNYKDNQYNNTMLGEYDMPTLISKIDANLIVLKVPYNQDMRKFKIMKIIPDVYKIDNYMLLVFNKLKTKIK